MRFVVIRHGQSTNNLLWESTGSEVGRDPDTPLTEVGHTQARMLGAHLAEGLLPYRIDAVYCSLMARAVQTAAPIAEALDLPLYGHPDLYEVGGPFDVDPTTSERSPHPGAGAEQLLALSRRLVLPESATADGWWSGPLENESDQPRARAEAVVAGIRARHADHETVALVSHGYFSQFLFREFLGITDMPGWVEIHNTSVTIYEDTPEFANCRAARTDWLPHLPEDLVTR